MQIGRMRDRITIQKVTTVNDGYGGQSETITEHRSMWAEVNPLRGREYFAAKQVNSERYYNFIVRYDKWITHQMRILFDTRTFEIEEILPIGQLRTYITLLAVERT